MICILLFSECQSLDSLPEGINELGVLHDITYNILSHHPYQSHSNQSIPDEVMLTYWQYRFSSISTYSIMLLL